MFLATVLHGKIYALVLTKDEFGYILGYFYSQTRLVTQKVTLALPT
jgi:hypothetical protein